MGVTVQYGGPDRAIISTLQERISVEMPSPTVVALDAGEALKLWAGNEPPPIGTNIWYLRSEERLFSQSLAKAREIRHKHGLMAVAVICAETTAAVGDMHFFIDGEGAPVTFQNLNELHSYIAQWCAEKYATD